MSLSVRLRLIIDLCSPWLPLALPVAATIVARDARYTRCDAARQFNAHELGHAGFLVTQMGV